MPGEFDVIKEANDWLKLQNIPNVQINVIDFNKGHGKWCEFSCEGDGRDKFDEISDELWNHLNQKKKNCKKPDPEDPALICPP